MGRAGHRRVWLRQHAGDPFVRAARQHGYRSRAAYKLIDIDDRDRLLQPGMIVVDLGAAPGGWSQGAVQRVGNRGRVLALDILPIDAIPGVEIIQGDFSEETVFSALLDSLGPRSVDLVLSDISPNISGVRCVDQARATGLAELVLDFAARTLKPGGCLLVKVFEGEGVQQLRDALRRSFHRVITRKPKSSRAQSREYYLLATDYNLP